MDHKPELPIEIWQKISNTANTEIVIDYKLEKGSAIVRIPSHSAGSIHKEAEFKAQEWLAIELTYKLRMTCSGRTYTLVSFKGRIMVILKD